MNRAPLLMLLSAATLVVAGCATSMTPKQFLAEFPSATRSRFFDRSAADAAIASGNCKLLVGGRKYVSPIGFTVDGDMEYGAEGVDQWVQADKGNAHALNSFEWISVGDQGATQLIVYFDTMLCG